MTAAKQAKEKTCGLIMPISCNAPYRDGHWKQVQDILTEAAKKAGFKATIVSEAMGNELIHKNIIQNIHKNDIVICDVSSRNPNVMFELGMRLLTKKPVILIKDELTEYNFDSLIIKHLSYNSTLNYFEIQDFQNALATEIKNVYEESIKTTYKPFIKHFGNYELSEIDADPAQLTNILNRIDQRISSLSYEQSSINSKINSINSKQFSLSTNSARNIASHGQGLASALGTPPNTYFSPTIESTFPAFPNGTFNITVPKT